MQNEQVTVISRKYDLSIRRTWKCRLVEQNGSHLTFVGEFDEPVEHSDLGPIEKGTISYEYYWLDRWYNIFLFHTPVGKLRNYYCNVNFPPKFEGGVLDYVDLDIDLIVWPDGRVVTLDEDEFAENAAKFEYAPYVRRCAFDAIDQLRALIDNREFPFSEL